ncbi:hypothetical protein OAE08_01350 [Gammaproteobacteria bacterium]|nr:hypothetical protein [Gammaproteobacteria bacterium]
MSEIAGGYMATCAAVLFASLRGEDLHLQQVLQEGEVEIIRMKQDQETPA